MQVTRIRKWKMVTPPGNGYTPPECLRPVFVGLVYGHPVKSDGMHIQTSDITAIDWKKGTFTTLHNEYQFDGAPDAEWAAWVRVNRPDLVDHLRPRRRRAAKP